MVLLAGLPAWAAPEGASASQDLTATSRYWIDTGARAEVDSVARGQSGDFRPVRPGQSFPLDDAALWLQVPIPVLETGHRWYLQVDFFSLDRVVVHLPDASGAWRTQQAGDRLPLSQWSIRDRIPVFELDSAASGKTIWLQIFNRPVPPSPQVLLVRADALQWQRLSGSLLLGVYFGFGLLVLFIGLIHARLYADRAFLAYSVYVGCMLGLQVAFTGVGGLLLWPQWPAWNNASPSVFTLLLTASSVWFVREVCATSRLAPRLDRFLLAWAAIGVVYPAIYISLLSRPALLVLHGYAFASAALGIAVCLWAWRRGERYAAWVALGFVPVALSFPLPALRNLGLLPGVPYTQYALLGGSALEIPLLLLVLHRRVRDFSENRARMRALDSTDPLTGLVERQVLEFRGRDAIRRARRSGHRCGLLLVELANHAALHGSSGREVGDRALVVAASRLSRVVRDVDTVSRIGDNRFAVLVEGPVRPSDLEGLATHMVAKGLAVTPLLPPAVTLTFRIATRLLPVDGDAGDTDGPETSAAGGWSAFDVLHQALDQLAAEPRRAIRHLGSAAEPG